MGKADENGQARKAAGHGMFHAPPVLSSLAWLQLPGVPGPGAGPGEGGGSAQTLLLAADRRGNLAALDTLGRSQPLRLLPAGRDPEPKPAEDLRCLSRAAWAGAAAKADASGGRLGPGRHTGQFAVCVLGRAAAGGSARGTHSGLVLTDGSTIAVFTVTPSGAVTGPPAQMATPMPVLAPDRSGAGMPSGNGSGFLAAVPAGAAAAGNSQCLPAMALPSKVSRIFPLHVVAFMR